MTVTASMIRIAPVTCSPVSSFPKMNMDIAAANVALAMAEEKGLGTDIEL